MEAINFTQKPEGATHFLRYASGHVVWCCVTEGGPNGQPMVSEWDSFNNYWVPCIHTMAHHQAIGMVEIVEGVETTAQPAQRPSEAPNGATHRYDHACTTAWYREVDGKLFVWRDGSWHGAVYKSTEELVKSCMLGRLTLLAMEQAEPVEDDLTWLVRETGGEWFGASRYIAKDGIEDYLWATVMRQATQQHLHWFTKDQYLARRAELQNKPSWEDAPEWAEWLAKDSPDKDEESAWWWYADKPVDMKNTWQVSTEGRAMIASSCHCDLGDWRDTLERRPADLSESAVTERLTEATQNVLAAVPALIDEKFKVELESPSDFGPDFFKEDGSGTIDKFMASVRETPVALSLALSSEELADLHQLCDAELTRRDAAVCGGQKYLDAHWFERGELPPVGAECEAFAEGVGPEKCKIIAYHKNQVAVQWFEFNDGCLDVLDRPGWSFRPFSTNQDRDALMVVLACYSGALPKAHHRAEVADAILAAGFKRGEV